jgi:hypothetical protein
LFVLPPNKLLAPIAALGGWALIRLAGIELTASAVALIGLHVITAVVVITGFAPTLSVACDRCEHAVRPRTRPATLSVPVGITMALQ